MKQKIIVITLIFLLVTCNLYQWLNTKNEVGTLKKIIEVVGDTLKIEKNKNKQYVSSIDVFTVESEKMFYQLKVKDKEIQELQKTIKQYKNKIATLTKFKSEIQIDTVIKTIVKYNENDLPVYKWNFKDEWIDLSGISNKNNTQFSLFITEKYDVTMYEEKKKLRISITNYNPYSKTTSIQSFYKQKPKQKKVGIGAYIGYGYNINQNFGFEIGIGINYNIFYLW